MWIWLSRYHADLVRQGDTSEDAMRYGDIQRIALPWFLPIGGMVICAIVAELVAGPPGVEARIVLALLFGLPGLLGMTHAMGTYLFAAIRADLRRKRRAS